jgi:hypothetical protein
VVLTSTSPPEGTGTGREADEGGEVLGSLLMFGGGGLALLLVGSWGLRRAGHLSAVEGWDEQARKHRKAVLCRGSFACLGVGTPFLAVLSTAFFGPPTR